MSGHSGGVRWRRVWFIPEIYPPGYQAGLVLDGVGQAHELYLNGVFIGGQGGIDHGFVEATTGQWLCAEIA